MVDADVSRVVIRKATYVERLAYTRAQAAAALGLSRSTFIRRVLPCVETIETGWGTQLVPVDELERFVTERRRKARAERRPPARPGRKIGLPPGVATRIRDENAEGKSLAEIARGLNRDGVPTSQGGRQWWPSTVRAVLVRSTPPNAAERR
jgi:Recombinase